MERRSLPDMLAIAKARADAIGMEIELDVADIRSIPFKDGYFELVTCMRFLNGLDADVS